MKNNIKSVVTLFIAALPLFAAGTSIAAYDGKNKKYSGQEFAKLASISISEARDIALKARPGEISDQELEKEKGGSGLRYSFDIRNNAVIYEVGVDAKSGKVLENAPEGKNPD